jgi:O-methyltransferase
MPSDTDAAGAPVPSPSLDEPQRLYLDLLKRTLTRFLAGSSWLPADPPTRPWKRLLFAPAAALAAAAGLRLARRAAFDPALRAEGRDWPADAETMIGLRRLDNLEATVVDVVRRGVPGDLVETGVWRGGAVIFMRGVLRALGDSSRRVWACDSFAGLPPPDPARYPRDEGDPHHTFSNLAVSVDEVRANFDRYGLLDGRVEFLPGWFRDTLPSAPIERIAVLRLDGDMYESTMVALESLYPRVSPGGYVIVDDYGAVLGCREAVEDYRRRHGIQEAVHEIDWTGVYWRRGASPAAAGG